MTTGILLSLITIVAILATCLEGRYHLEATGLKHHRHDRHRQDRDQELGATGFRRRDWEEYDDGETSVNHRHKERNAVSAGRRTSDRTFPLGHDRWGSGGTARRGRYEPQRRWRTRPEGRHLGRDYYHGGLGPSQRYPSEESARSHREANRHTSVTSGRGERPWTHRKFAGYGRRRDYEDEDYAKPENRMRGWYDDEDEGYEADDEEYRPLRKAGNSYEGHSKGRRNRHEYKNWRDEWRRRADEDDEQEEDEDVDDYDQDYEDYEFEETEKRVARRKHGKRLDEFDESHGHSAQNEVAARRGGRKRGRLFGDEKETREKPEDLNEVEEDDVWADAETDDDDDGDLDEYDDTGISGFDSTDTKKHVSSVKAIDDIIRRLTVGDTTTTTTTPKSTPRRDYRNIDNDKHPGRDRYGNFHESKQSPRLQPHRSAHRKHQNTWETSTTTTTTTTTKKPGSYVKYTNELNGVANSSRNEVDTVEKSKKVTKVKNGDEIEAQKALATQLTKTEPGAKTKSLEQDYEEYENDGSDDKSEDADEADAETESDKKWPSEKDRDYEEENAEDNEDETEKPLSTSTLSLPSTTTTSTTTTTTTTTTTLSPPISTRAFDHRQSKILDTRSGYNGWKYPRTISTDYPPMSNYSIHKWKTLGSRKAVSDSRIFGKTDNRGELTRLAIDHVTKMNKEAICQWPRPKVISVHEVYPSPSKTYRPHCTILHRCADDTGCCKSEGTTCVPKSSHTVELSFYTFVVGASTQTEKLKFINHTECHCRPRPPPPPPPPIINPCKCPSNFTPRVTTRHECQCYCPDHRMDCIRQKRGKEYFSPSDRWCIQKDQCTTPACDFGEYMRKHGRCPQKIERFNTTTPYSNYDAEYRN